MRRKNAANNIVVSFCFTRTNNDGEMPHSYSAEYTFHPDARTVRNFHKLKVGLFSREIANSTGHMKVREQFN